MKIYSLATLIFFSIDMIWLGLVAKQFYSDQIGFLLTKNVNWLAALTFYFLFIAGLVVFVINPALEKKSVVNALILGGFFGLVSYATYDLTNLATIKNWPVLLTIVDLIWGTTLGGFVSAITVFIATKFKL